MCNSKDITFSEKFGQLVVIPGDSMVELGLDHPESLGIAKWDFLTSGVTRLDLGTPLMFS